MAVLSNASGSSTGPESEEFLLHENSRINKPAIKKEPLFNLLFMFILFYSFKDKTRKHIICSRENVIIVLFYSDCNWPYAVLRISLAAFSCVNDGSPIRS